MANQANFPDPLNGTFFQRPERVAAKDLNLLRPGQQQIIFGTTNNDNVEIYVYNPDGSLVGHQTIGPLDTALTLTTLIDNTGAYELLNVDMKDVCNRMGIAPGRYSFVCNFFRDEVGSEAGYKLYISQISDDRTELQLTPVQVTPQTVADLYDWVVPGVPREFAAGLIDQLFSADISGSLANAITPDKVAGQLDALIPGTTGRINYAGAGAAYTLMVNTILTNALPRALDYLANDVFNNEVQQIELDGYVIQAFLDVLYTMQQQNAFDPRFNVILPTIID